MRENRTIHGTQRFEPVEIVTVHGGQESRLLAGPGRGRQGSKEEAMSTNATEFVNRNALGLSDEDILTIAEVATWLDVKQSWVRAHANRRRQPHLPSLKLGKYRRFKRGAIRDFLSKLEAEGRIQ